MKRIVTVAASTPESTRKGEGDVVELPDGRLLLVYMEFSGDGSDHASTRLVAVDSADGGVTWSNHRVVTDTAPGDLNVYSPNLIDLPGGTVLMLFMRQHDRGNGGDALSHATQHVWSTRDGGESWTPYAVFAERQPLSLCNAVIKRLSSGRLMVPFSTRARGTGNTPGYGGTTMHSDDDGRTWTAAENRIHLPMRGVMEPHVEEASDGRLLMVMRNQLGSLFISESTDGGAHWSKPQTSGLRTPESCPCLTRIPSSGDLVMIWNNSPYDPAFASHYGKRSPLTAAVSKDNGRTWGPPRDIEDDPARAFSNPGCRFTRTGRAVINYWTCEYLPNGYMQDVIDLRVALLEPRWFGA